MRLLSSGERPYRIVCPRRLVEDFKRVALDRHPREAYAVFFGRFEGTKVDIQDVWYPEDQGKFATTSAIETIAGRPAWWMKALDIADSGGLEIVGDIHSHPETDPKRLKDPSPSYADWKIYQGPKWIRAICVVCKRPRSVKFRVTFWPPLPKAIVRYK
jgi:proteasome lid subunit RPN8/RPN11